MPLNIYPLHHCRFSPMIGYLRYASFILIAANLSGQSIELKGDLHYETISKNRKENYGPYKFVLTLDENSSDFSSYIDTGELYKPNNPRSCGMVVSGGYIYSYVTVFHNGEDPAKAPLKAQATILEDHLNFSAVTPIPQQVLFYALNLEYLSQDFFLGNPNFFKSSNLFFGANAHRELDADIRVESSGDSSIQTKKIYLTTKFPTKELRLLFPEYLFAVFKVEYDKRHLPTVIIWELYDYPMAHALKYWENGKFNAKKMIEDGFTIHPPVLNQRSTFTATTVTKLNQKIDHALISKYDKEVAYVNILDHRPTVGTDMATVEMRGGGKIPFDGKRALKTGGKMEITSAPKNAKRNIVALVIALLTILSGIAFYWQRKKRPLRR